MFGRFSSVYLRTDTNHTHLQQQSFILRKKNVHRPVLKHWREGEREKKKGNCKASSVTRKHNYKAFCFKKFNYCKALSVTHKRKHKRENHSPFMNKALSIAVMLRTKLRNTFLKKRSDKNLQKKKKLQYTTKLLCFTFAKM